MRRAHLREKEMDIKWQNFKDMIYVDVGVDEGSVGFKCCWYWLFA